MKHILWIFGVLGYAGTLWSAAPGAAGPTPIKSEDLLIRSSVGVQEVTATPEIDPMSGVADTMVKIRAKVVGACTNMFLADLDRGNARLPVLSFGALKTNRAHTQPACFNELEFDWSPTAKGRYAKGLVQPIQLIVHSGRGPNWDRQGQLVLAKDFLVTGELEMNMMSLPKMKGWVTTYRNLQVSEKDRALTPAEYEPLFSSWVQNSLRNIAFQSGTAPLFVIGAVYEPDTKNISLNIVPDGSPTGRTTEANLQADVEAFVNAKLQAQQFPFPVPGVAKIKIENLEYLKTLPILN